MRFAAAVAALALAAASAPAQEGPVWLPHVPFVTTSPEVARAMLELAQVKPSDTVYDLGCGDGRIVILAAQRYGARGVGIDIDPERIREANENARRAGVADKVRFIHADLLYADIRGATVVSMFLLPSVNLKLRPKLLRDLQPGTRIVTHNFDIGDWKPDRQTVADGVPVYLWNIPHTVSAAGRVTLEDGAPPPVPVSIEKVCGARVSFEGYTATGGEFSVAVESFQAADGCRVRAALPGYRSGVFELRENIGTIPLRRVAKSEGSFLSGPSATALFQRGAQEEARGRLDESAEAYRKAIAADPKYLSPYLGLVQVAMHRNEWQDVAVYAEKVIALDPESFPDAYLYHAIGCLTLRRFEDAAHSAREAMRLDADRQFPRAEYVLALALAAQKDLAGARDHLARYIEADPKAPDIDQIKERLALLAKP